MNTELETIDFTPTWEVATQMLLLVINNADNDEAKREAEHELLRMASILDELQKREAKI
tara:strand:+ start:189 stop:365 length:177 start_codon:yes stop_codon:yes gene_type:complete